MESNQEQHLATHARALTAGGLTLMLGVYFLAAAGNGTAAGNKEGIWKPFLPEADLSKIIDDEVQIIQKELVKPKPDEKKVRASAFVIALASQNCKDGGEPRQLGPLRGSALKLAEAAGKMNLAEMKKEAKQIANYKKLQNGDDLKPVDLKKYVEELGDAMLVFERTEKGGEGIEKELVTLDTQRKPFTPAQMSDKLLLIAYKAALIAEVAQAYDDLAKNQKKDWHNWTDDMRQGAIDLAEAVKSKKIKEKSKDVKTAIKKLNSACFACHAKFRDK
jgi:cytochrome c556